MGCGCSIVNFCSVRIYPGSLSDVEQLHLPRSCSDTWCAAHAGQYPSLKDWETHLTTIFPEVRLKRYMEMRGADGGPWDSICALPALWVGLLYTRWVPPIDSRAIL